MYRIGLAIVCFLLLACNGKEKKRGEDHAVAGNKNPAGFNSRFKVATLPYQLTDTALLHHDDTARLAADYLTALLSDSTIKNVFGKAKNIHYSPMVKLAEPGKETYYLVKAVGGDKTAAFLLVFDRKGNYIAATPFLIADSDPSITQSSSIDKSYVITRAITQKNGAEVTGEGKEVLAYDARKQKFSLIMTDLLNDESEVLVNPLDTFPKTNKLAGDYYKNKKNLVSVRDGRHPNQILVYIHTENSEGDCRGELKGEFILTSTKTAVYRQGGDPCILALSFKGNTVSINEERGCGNYRGLDCPFDGSFTRKKEEIPKETTKTAKRPKRAK